MTVEEFKNKFIEKIETLNLNLSCPCGTKDFLVDGPFLKVIQKNPKNFSIGGPSIPYMSIICKKCGYSHDFALGPLGMLEDLKNIE